MEAGGIRVARVYDAPAPEEGTRILVDRVWPRGVRKSDPRAGRWERDVAPSTELRRWYGHDPARFAEFAARYRRELAAEPAATVVRRLRELAREGPVTLVTATSDVTRSQARVLADQLREPDPS